MTDNDERERLSATFDAAAASYQQVRPDYPAELYARLLSVTGLQPPARLLEIGCATGKATLALARRGFSITCIEPGPALATQARRNLAPFTVDVVESRFEDWDPGAVRYALVYAATAWHWVDPALRYGKAAAVLEPDGHLAIWEAIHVIPVDGDPFFDEIQDVYDEINESRPEDDEPVRPQAAPDRRDEIEATGLFDVVDLAQFDWEVTYDAQGYIDLLNTFSGHIAMEQWQRDRLYGEVRRRLAARPDGLLRRHWGGALHIARRR